MDTCSSPPSVKSIARLEEGELIILLAPEWRNWLLGWLE